MEIPKLSDSEDSCEILSNITTIKRRTFYKYKWQVIIEKPSCDYETKLIMAPEQKLPDGFGNLKLTLETGKTKKEIIARISIQENGNKRIVKDNIKYFLHFRMYENLKKIGQHVVYLNKNMVYGNMFEARYHIPITRNQILFDGLIASFKMIEEWIVNQEPIPILSSSWNSDFKQLYNNEEHHDVVFIVGPTTFKAHKLILMVRSPVFQAMFSVDMIEKKDNKVTIENIRSDVFAQLLKYIYTDEVDKDRVNIELGLAANMYGLLRLLSICNNHLQKTIDVSNAIAIIKYSSDVNCDELRNFGIKFVKSHEDQFSKTDVKFVNYLEPRKKQRV